MSSQEETALRQASHHTSPGTARSPAAPLPVQSGHQWQPYSKYGPALKYAPWPPPLKGGVRCQGVSPGLSSNSKTTTLVRPLGGGLDVPVTSPTATMSNRLKVFFFTS